MAIASLTCKWMDGIGLGWIFQNKTLVCYNIKIILVVNGDNDDDGDDVNGDKDDAEPEALVASGRPGDRKKQKTAKSRHNFYSLHTTTNLFFSLTFFLSIFSLATILKQF